MSTDIVVSVAMVTYNQERYVAQSIESVLMQEAAFSIELVVGDDFSTDDTRNIVKAYAARYPRQIKALLHPKNLGPSHSPGKHNMIAVRRECRSKYTAVLEGDDYWTDSQKLQKQVEYLEANPECSMCFHNTSIHFQDGRKESSPRYRPGQKAIWVLEDILYRNPITTCSAVFRNGIADQMPPWFFAMSMGDWPLWVLLAQHGPVGYLDEDMATYRVHEGGVFSGRRSLEWIPSVLAAYQTFDEIHDGVYHDRIVQGKIGYLDSVAEEFMADSELSMPPGQAVQAFQSLWRRHAETPPPSERQLLGRLYAHRFFRAAKSHDFRTMRSCVLLIARYDRSWFRNRGFLSNLWTAASNW